jgi:hypothetical protein
MQYESLLDELLSKLYNKWEFTTEQIQDIREKILEYGASAIMDSTIQKEIFKESERTNL